MIARRLVQPGWPHRPVFPKSGPSTGTISSPDLRSAIVTERIQLTAEMMRAYTKRPLDRARKRSRAQAGPMRAAERKASPAAQEARRCARRARQLDVRTTQRRGPNRACEALAARLGLLPLGTKTLRTFPRLMEPWATANSGQWMPWSFNAR
jgi:hypothetical protein